MIRFEKHTPTGVLRCQMVVFADSGALAWGDNDLELICEDSPDAWKDGVEYLRSEGYVETEVVLDRLRIEEALLAHHEERRQSFRELREQRRTRRRGRE
jgi:hypothetical protein